MSSEPALVLVLGMHRSGTSLLGSLLGSLGVALPGELIAADRHNPEGYFERHDITGLQEQLLIDLGRWWPSATGVEPLPDNWLHQPCTVAARERLRNLLAAEQQLQPGAWAIKDPRTSLLLPLWRQVADELELPLRLVCSVRDPAEVMLSVLRRDHDAAGMDPWRAQQLWWRHNHQVLRDSSGLPLLFLRYEDWFDPSSAEAGLKALATFCGIVARGDHLPDEILRRGLQLVRPEHRRSQAIDPLPLPIHPSLIWLNQRLSSQLEPSKNLIAEPLPEASSLVYRCRVQSYGCTSSDWEWHAWLQRFPLPQGFELIGAEAGHGVAWPVLALHLQELPDDHDLKMLEEMRQLSMVLDPDPKRVDELSLRGIKARCLDPEAPANGWLGSDGDLAACTSSLGLPPPGALHANHQKSSDIRCPLLCLGTAGEGWEASLQSPVWNLVGFDQLSIGDAQRARCLASWLDTSQKLGIQLVRLNPSWREARLLGYAALSHPKQLCSNRRNPDWMPTQIIQGAITQTELIKELSWIRQGRPDPAPCRTPGAWASQHLHWQYDSGQMPSAGVCISLLDTEDRIIDALESVYRQTHQALELIVVDDVADDRCIKAVQHWLERHGTRFSRSQLVVHGVRRGRAASLNIAFENATAPWCFILNANSELEPTAVELCLAVAEAAPQSTGVVNPLVFSEPDPSLAKGEHENCTQGHLVSRVSFQRELSVPDNNIPVIAMIRRKSWNTVGGCTATESGCSWDQDLWNKFMKAGFDEVLCPQRLARYRPNEASSPNFWQNFKFHAIKRSLQRAMSWPG